MTGEKPLTMGKREAVRLRAPVKNWACGYKYNLGDALAGGPEGKAEALPRGHRKGQACVSVCAALQGVLMVVTIPQEATMSSWPWTRGRAAKCASPWFHSECPWGEAARAARSVPGDARRCRTKVRICREILREKRLEYRKTLRLGVGVTVVARVSEAKAARALTTADARLLLTASKAASRFLLDKHSRSVVQPPKQQRTPVKAFCLRRYLPDVCARAATAVQVQNCAALTRGRGCAQGEMLRIVQAALVSHQEACVASKAPRLAPRLATLAPTRSSPFVTSIAKQTAVNSMRNVTSTAKAGLPTLLVEWPAPGLAPDRSLFVRSPSAVRTGGGSSSRAGAEGARMTSSERARPRKRSAKRPYTSNLAASARGAPPGGSPVTLSWRAAVWHEGGAAAPRGGSAAGAVVPPTALMKPPSPLRVRADALPQRVRADALPQLRALDAFSAVRSPQSLRREVPAAADIPRRAAEPRLGGMRRAGVVLRRTWDPAVTGVASVSARAANASAATSARALEEFLASAEDP